MLVVDDEELARLRLRGLVDECPSRAAHVVGEAANAAQALVWLATQQCDVVLLDIQMPGRDGTQLAAELRGQDRSPAVVFVTAHAEHALQAFDLDAVDYLTKPVRRERLQAALQRAAQRARVADAGAGARGRSGAGAGRQRPRPRGAGADVGSAVPEGRAQVRDLRTPSAPTCSTTRSPNSRSASATRFLRVHRNALVARKAVRALERR